MSSDQPERDGDRDRDRTLPQRASSSTWRQEHGTSPVPPNRTSSAFPWPPLAFGGGLPTSYSHERKASTFAHSSPPTSASANPYGLPASMNPGLPPSSSSPFGESSISPSSPSWHSWQSILRERDNNSSSNRAILGSLYQGPATTSTSGHQMQSSASSGSSHTYNVPPHSAHGRAYRPPSTATLSSDSGTGHGTVSSTAGTTGTWARSQKSSQTSLPSHPSPSMMLLKLHEGRNVNVADTASSAGSPNTDENSGTPSAAATLLAAGAEPRTSTGPDVPVSPSFGSFSELPRTSDGDRSAQVEVQLHPSPPRSVSAAVEMLEETDDHLKPTSAPTSQISAVPQPPSRSSQERPPLSPIPGSISGSDNLALPTPTPTRKPNLPSTSAVSTQGPSVNSLRQPQPSPHMSEFSVSTTSTASEERHRDAFVASARAKYLELQALHLAELRDYDRVFEQEGVLTAKNGCEQVFMPKPSLSVQRYDESRRSSTSGCLGRDSDMEGGDGRKTPRAISFERNRRPNKSLSALATASTPDLRSTAGAQGSKGRRRFTGHHRPPPPLPIIAGSAGRSSAESGASGRARSNSEPPSPTQLLSVQGPSDDAQGGPRTPALDPSTSGSSLSSEESSLRSSLDLDTVLRQGRELEEERQAWRREFDQSIEGRGTVSGTGSGGRSPSCLGGGEAHSSSPTLPSPRARDLMSRYELFQAGPVSETGAKKRFTRASSRLLGVGGGRHSGLHEPVQGSPPRRSPDEQQESNGSSTMKRFLRSSKSSPQMREKTKEQKKKVTILEPESQDSPSRRPKTTVSPSQQAAPKLPPLEPLQSHFEDSSDGAHGTPTQRSTRERLTSLKSNTRQLRSPALGSETTATPTAAERRSANLVTPQPVVIAAAPPQEAAPTTATADATRDAAATPPHKSTASQDDPRRLALRNSGSASGVGRGSSSDEKRRSESTPTPPSPLRRPSLGFSSSRRGSTSSSAGARRRHGLGGSSRPSSPPPPHPPPDAPLPALPSFAAAAASQQATPSPPPALGLAISGAATSGDSKLLSSTPPPLRLHKSSPSNPALRSTTLPSPTSPIRRKPVPALHIEGQDFVLAGPSSSRSVPLERDLGSRDTTLSTTPHSAGLPTSTTMHTSGSSTAEWVLHADAGEPRLASSSGESLPVLRSATQRPGMWLRRHRSDMAVQTGSERGGREILVFTPTDSGTTPSPHQQLGVLDGQPGLYSASPSSRHSLLTEDAEEEEPRPTERNPRGRRQDSSSGGGLVSHSAASSISRGTGSAAYELWDADREDVVGDNLFLQRLRSIRSRGEMAPHRGQGEGGGAKAGEAEQKGRQGDVDEEASAAPREGSGRDESGSTSRSGGRSSSGGIKRWWKPR